MKKPMTGDEISELRDYCKSFGSVGSLTAIRLLDEIERQRAALRRLVEALGGSAAQVAYAAAEARRVLGEG